MHIVTLSIPKATELSQFTPRPCPHESGHLRNRVIIFIRISVDGTFRIKNLFGELFQILRFSVLEGRFVLKKACGFRNIWTCGRGPRPTVYCPVSGRYQYPDTENKNSIFEAPFSVIGKASISNESCTFQL